MAVVVDLSSQIIYSSFTILYALLTIMYNKVKKSTAQPEKMEKLQSRRSRSPAELPRLIRSRSEAPAMSAGMPPETPAYNSQSPAYLRSVHRSRSTTRSRTTVEEEKSVRSPCIKTSTTTKSSKKNNNISHQENIKDVGGFAKFLQRSSNSGGGGGGGGEVSKRMVRAVVVGPTSPSAWALSPGRVSPCSTVAKVPPSPGKIGGGGGGGGGAMSGVFKYFKQKKMMRMEEMEIHRFRIVQNRLLQWRFANAKAEAAMAAKKTLVEKKVFNVWLEMMAIRKSNMELRIQIQRLKQEIKLYYMIDSQLFSLREWAKLESKNFEAMSRIARKLSAISIRLPLVQGAKADVLRVEDAVSMATGVIEGIETLIMKFYLQVEKRCYLLTELSVMAKEQKEHLEELENWILIVTSLKAEEKSLRAHLVQITEEPKQEKLRVQTRISRMSKVEYQIAKFEKLATGLKINGKFGY